VLSLQLHLSAPPHHPALDSLRSSNPASSAVSISCGVTSGSLLLPASAANTSLQQQQQPNIHVNPTAYFNC
jgi:hypothetical protein